MFLGFRTLHNLSCLGLSSPSPGTNNIHWFIWPQFEHQLPQLGLLLHTPRTFLIYYHFFKCSSHFPRTISVLFIATSPVLYVWVMWFNEYQLLEDSLNLLILIHVSWIEGLLYHVNSQAKESSQVSYTGGWGRSKNEVSWKARVQH